MTYEEVDDKHDVDALLDDLADVHLDVVDDVLAEFSKMSLWMFYVDFECIVLLNFLMLSSVFYLHFLMVLF